VVVPKTSHEAGASAACPECGIEMVIIRITPILFGGKFEDLTLACKKCGSTKELRIKRNDDPI
jgi:transcription elongation factor Elf1